MSGFDQRQKRLARAVGVACGALLDEGYSHTELAYCLAAMAATVVRMGTEDYPELRSAAASDVLQVFHAQLKRTDSPVEGHA